MDNDFETIKLPSSLWVKLSQPAFEKYYVNFGEDTLFVFDDCISAGVHFPRIVRLIFIFITLFTGHTDWQHLFLGNIIPGVFATVIWHLFRLYKIPALRLIICIIGGDIMRIYLHYLPLALFLLYILRDWKILLVCVLSSLTARGACAIVRSLLATVKYNDAVAKYVYES